MAIGNPWGAAAQSYGQDVDQLTKIQMGGMQQAAQMPLQLYDRFMDGYERARQRAAQEQQMQMQQAQLDRQNRLVDLKFQQDKEHQDYVMREDERKRLLGGLKEITDTSGDMIDKYTPDAREVYRQRFYNAAITQGKKHEDALAFADKMLPPIKTTPVVSSVQPDTQDNTAFNEVADIPNTWEFSPAETQEDKFKGRMVLDQEERERKDRGLEKYRIDKETRVAQDALEQRKLEARRADIMQQNADTAARRAESVGQVKPKAIPPSAAKALLENKASLARIEEAIALLDANPDALGPKNILLKYPQTAFLLDASRGGDIEGNRTRAAVQGMTNLVLHDLSGAAVTLSEDTRFQPVLPQLHQPTATGKTKLTQLAKQYRDTIERMGEMYSSDNGYMENSVLRGGGKKQTEPAAQPKDGETRADGARYSAKGGGWFKKNAAGKFDKVN